MSLHNIIVDLVIVVGAATASALLCQALRVPVLVGFILAGVAVGPYGFGFVQTIPGASLIAEIGVIFLLFTIGLELSFKAIKRYRRIILGVGINQVFFCTGFTFLVCFYLLDFHWSQALFWGFLLSLSSTAIVLKLLIDERETRSPYGTAATGMLLTQDIFVIPMTLAIPIIAPTGPDASTVSLSDLKIWIGQFVLVGIGIYVAGKYLVPFLLEKVIRTRSRELFFFFLLFLCLGFALIFETLSFSLALGALLSGLLVSESPFGRQATSEIVPLRDSFLAFFFASIGMLVDTTFVIQHLPMIVLLSCVVIVIKTILSSLAVWITRVPLKSALVAGAMVFQIGEFSFVLAGMGKEQGLLSPLQFQYFLSVSVISMMLTPFVFKAAPKFFLRKFGKTDHAVSEESQVEAIIIGYGVAGIRVASYLKQNKFRYIVIEQNYNLVKQAKSLGEPILFGDGADTRTLYEAGLKTASLIVVCVAGIESTRAVVEKVLLLRRNVKVCVRVQYTLETVALEGLVPPDLIVDSESVSSSVLVEKVKETLSLPDPTQEKPQRLKP